jgi:hypothetical protein
MFDRVSEAAEKLATNVSRRAFLGGLGKGALALAGAMGTMLAFPGMVHASSGCFCPNGGSPCCIYTCADGSQLTTRTNSICKCSPQHKGCALSASGCVCSGP